DTSVTADTRPFLTGVVFNDYNNNGKYEPGEGIGNVTISIPGVGSTTTFSSGGYSLQVSPGTYTVTASGGGLATTFSQTVTVGATNYRLNVNALNLAGNRCPLSVVNDASGRPVVFVMGLDDQVYAQKFDYYGNSAGSYFLASVGKVKSFTVGRDGAGNPELFAIGLNDRVYAQKFDGNDNPVGGYFLTTEGAVKSVVAGRDAY